MSGKILLIDPIATNRISLGSILRAAHYQIDAVASLNEVSSLLNDTLFDAVIISLNTPLDLVKLKAMPALSTVPVIASQQQEGDAARLALLHAGASDILTALVSRKVLLTRLRSLLRARNASAELRLREDTNRALGFHEAEPPFQSKSEAALCAMIQNPARACWQNCNRCEAFHFRFDQTSNCLIHRKTSRAIHVSSCVLPKTQRGRRLIS